MLILVCRPVGFVEWLRRSAPTSAIWRLCVQPSQHRHRYVCTYFFLFFMIEKLTHMHTHAHTHTHALHGFGTD